MSTLDGIAAFAEGGPAVVLDTSVEIFDADLATLAGGAGDYGGATLVIHRLGGAVASDVLVAGTTASTAGVLTLTFAPGTTQAAVNAILSSITFALTANLATSNADAAFAWTFSDGAVPTPLSAAGTTVVSLAGVNEAPQSADLTRTFVEDTTLTLALADFAFFDPDLGNELVAIRLTGLGPNGQLFLDHDGSPTTAPQLLAIGQSVPRLGIALGRLTFSPLENVFGDDLAGFSFEVYDGEAYSTSAYDATFDITPVVEPPVLGADAVPGLAENSPGGSTIATLYVADHDDEPEGFLLGSNAVAAGYLTLVDASGADITNGLGAYRLLWADEQWELQVSAAIGAAPFDFETIERNGSGQAIVRVRLSDGGSAATFEVVVPISNVSDADIDGTSAPNTLTGTGEGTEGGAMEGHGGADLIDGGGGDDRLEGGDGDDTLDGGAGADSLLGGAADDTIVWDAGDNLAFVLGGTGTDTLRVVGSAPPTSFDLAAHEFERAVVSTADAGGNWWQSITDVYNAGWQRTNRDTLADDGRLIQTTFDVSPGGTGINWQQVSDYRSAGGVLTNQDGVFDDGSAFSKAFDYAAGTGVDGVADWLREYTYFFRHVTDQQSGLVRNVEGFADDGRKFTQTNDIDANQAWTFQTNWYETDGTTLDFLEIRWDDGSTQIIPY